MKTNTGTRPFVLLVMVLAVLSTLLGVTAQEEELPMLVLANWPNFFPEGIEWDSDGGRFLLSSAVSGNVYEVADSGTVTPLVQDEDLAGTGGIHIDAERSRLLVAQADVRVLGDPEFEGQGAVGIYNLFTGGRIQLVSLRDLRPTGKQMVNDVTVDDEGNIYGTDAFAPVIYCIDLEGNASIFLEDNLMNPEPIGLIPFPVGLNGIVHHPDGFLLAAHTSGGRLFRISLDEPRTVSDVELNEPFGADGMVLRPTGELVAVAVTFNPEGKPQFEVIEVVSEDHWESATITNRVNVSELPPTTVVLRDDAVYVIAMHMDAMLAGEAIDAYEIYRIDFDVE